MCFTIRFGGLHVFKAVATFESPFRYVSVGGSLVIYMLQTKFSLSFARRVGMRQRQSLVLWGSTSPILFFKQLTDLSKKIIKFFYY